MRSTPEKDKIDSNCMRVEAMTEKGEVSFAKEFKRSLDLCGEIVTTGDKKHAKREAKACLKQKYYWVHKEEDALFNGMKAVYKILNNKDKVSMKHFYHIRCDPELGEGFCTMLRLPCAYNGFVEQLSKLLLPNLGKTQQPRYVIEPETCKYSSILRGYNKLHICQIEFKERNDKPKRDED